MKQTYPLMTITHTKRKWLTIAGVSMLSLLLVAGAIFYYLINNNIRQIISEIVHRESKGNLAARMNSFQCSWTTNRLEVKDFELYSADSSTAQTVYRVKIPDFNIKTNSLWDIILHKNLHIDSVSIKEPDISIHVLQKKTGRKKNISLSEEVGHVYDGIKRILKALHLKRFEINNARLLFDNQTTPGSTPLQISNIQFIVDNLKIDGSIDEDKEKFLFADSIILRSYDQRFTLPDGRHQVGYARLRFNSGLRLIELDSCTITRFATENSASAFNAFFDTLRITNLDFNALYLEDRIIADSAYCINPSLEATLLPIEKKDSGSLKKSISFLSSTDGSVSIKYVGVHNGQLQVTSEKKGKRSSLQTAGFNFSMFGLEAGSNAEKGLHFDSIGLSLQKNEFYTPDSNYCVKFDDIDIIHDSLLLTRFRITTEAKEHISIQRHHTADKLVLSGVDWESLLVQKRVVAQKAILYNPVIDRRNDERSKRKKGLPLFELFAGLRKSIDLEVFDVRNGALRFDMGTASGISLEGVNMLIHTNDLLSATQFSSIGTYVEHFSFSKGLLHLNGKQIRLSKGLYTGRNNRLYVNNILIEEKQRATTIKAEAVQADGIVFDSPGKEVRLNGLRWKKAITNIKLTASPAASNTPGKTTITISNLRIGETALALETKTNAIIATKLEQLSAEQIQLRPGANPLVKGLMLKGSDLNIGISNANISCNRYEFIDGSETNLHDLRFMQQKENDSFAVNIPIVRIQPAIASSIASGTLQIDLLSLINPSFSFKKEKKEKTGSTAKQRSLPGFLVKKILVQHTGINIITSNKDAVDSIRLKAVLQGQHLSHSKDGQLTIQYLQLKAAEPLYRQAAGILLHSPDSIDAIIKDVVLHTGQSNQWNLHLSDLRLSNTKLLVGKKDSSAKAIHFSTLNLHDLQLNHELVKDVSSLLKKNPSFSLSNTSFSFRAKDNILQLHNLQISPGQSAASIGSFSYSPVQTKEEFVNANPYQADYIAASTGPISVTNVSIHKLIKDGILDIQQIQIDEPYISVYRDKNKPFQDGIIKPLPVNMLKQINLPINIGLVALRNGTVIYTERSDKTKESGTMHFGNVQALLSNLRNYNLTDTDSLSLKAQTIVMESIPARLHFRESYTDSLAGFVLGVQLKSADLTRLNPVLAPLVSMQLESGTLDTMVMYAVGREYLSLGQMHMYYRNLNVRFLQKGNIHKKTLLTSFISFVANDFVIRRNNKDRQGMIYFPRTREKAIFNYWVKIILSGLASSTGARSNKKIMKKYRSELKKKALPAINFDL